MYQAPFERVDHLGIEHALDIHWRIANPQVVSQVLTHDELLERSVTVRVQEAPMRVLSSVDALLVACVHRVAHHPDFEKPIWIQDIHLLATGLEPSEWRTFVERAVSRSIRAVCLDGLQQAQARFQTEIPLEVLTSLGSRTRGTLGDLPSRGPASRRSPGVRLSRAQARCRSAARAGASVPARRLHAGRLWLQQPRAAAGLLRGACVEWDVQVVAGRLKIGGGWWLVVGGNPRTTDHQPPTIQLALGDEIAVPVSVVPRVVVLVARHIHAVEHRAQNARPSGRQRFNRPLRQPAAGHFRSHDKRDA